MNIRLMAELFGGADRYRALKSLLENPGRDFGARELAAHAGIDPGNASRWLRRWTDAGILQKTVVLKQPRYRVSSDPSLKPLQEFFQQGSELVSQLSDRLSKLGERVETAVVFGSIAKGSAGAESDIDLLLVGDLSRLEAQAFFKPTARKLGRPVNVLTYSADEWQQSIKDKDPLVLEVLQEPNILLKGNLGATAKA